MADWYVKGNTATLSQTFYDETTGLAASATGTPTVTITGSDGVTTYTPTAVVISGAPVYTTTFVPTVLDSGIVVKWTGVVNGLTTVVTKYVDVVGGWPFTIADLRAFKPEFTNTTRYPYALLLQSRVQAVKWMDKLLGTGVTPRAATYTFQGRGLPYGYTARTAYDGTAISLPHWKVTAIRSITVDGATVLPSSVVLDSDMGIVRNLYTSPSSIVTITYEYGFTTIPDPGFQPLLLLATELTLPNSLSPRVTGVTNDIGFMRIQTPTAAGGTGIPDVDAFVGLYGRRAALGIA